ncbi:autotransporter-associated beta strand repeat-containing protein [Candidatus Pelagibacter sp. HIMB1542]|uniref:autotransporter-associated beta strand repeat-containing protein n=1 Tax=Candidatus Pelagibacter sp. HIMB1542 TaxID=3413346 RepID=UPI003F82ED45
MLLELNEKFLFLKKFICCLFLIFIFSFNGKSLANTINENTDTVENNNLDLDGDIKASTTYNITNNAVYTLNGEILSNGYDLTKQGNGTLILNANSSNFGNVISNTFTIEGGLVGIGNNGSFGSANNTISLEGGGISSSNTSSRSISNDINITSSTTIGNATNNGALTLSGDASISGGKHTVTSNSNNTLSGAVNLGGQNITFDTASGVTSTISGIVSNGNVVKSGSGTLKLTGTNTQSQTVLNGGILEVATDRGLGSEPGSLVSDNIRIVDATLKFSNTGTITLHANRGITLANNNATIEVTNSGARVNYYGDITGNYNLTKTGSGILALGAANTHDLSGDVTVSAGQMIFVSGTSDAYSFDVIVANGANASVNNDAFASGNSITVQSGGSLNFYPGTDSGRTYSMDISLSGSGNNNLNSGTAATLTSSYDRNTTLTGTVTLTADSNVLHKPNLNSDASNKFIFGNSNGSATTAINLGSNTFTLLAEGTNAREYQFLDLVIGTGTLDVDRYTTADFTSGEGGFADTVNLDVQGTLNMGSSDTIASLTGTSTGSIDLQNTTLTIDQDTNTTYAGVITDSTGTSSIVKSGTGTLTLSGTNSYSGNTTLNAGNLSISADNNLGSAPGTADADNIIFNGGGLIISSGVTFDSNRGVTMTGAGTINTASSTTSNIQGVITGSGALTKSGDGTLTLSATNTNTGDITISAGTLDVQGQLESGNYDGAISNSGQLKINSSSNQTLAGTISGTGILAKTGSGTLTLTGTNTYSGQTTIEGGTVVASNSSSLGATPGSVASTNIVLNNGTLQTTNSFSIGSNKGITVVGSGGTINTDASTTLTYGGVISNNGTLTKTGDGTLTLSGANTYTGATTVSAGTLNVTGTLSDDTAITVSSGATYDVDASDTIKSIDGAGTIDIASGQTLTAGDATNKTFSGVIQGLGGLAKTGTGTLTLSGTNTYTGDTTISQGGITLQGQLESGNYDGAIANSGTLTVDSSSNQTLAGVISGTGALNKSGSGTLTLSGTNTYSGSTTITNGTISVSSSANLGATPSSADGDNIIFNGGTLSATNDFTLGTNKGITLTGNGTIDVASSNTMTFDGIITDSGNLTKSGSGTLVLGGANQNDGTITVNSGILEISDQYSLGSSSGGTVVADGASLKITDAITITNESLTLNGNGVSNGGALQAANTSGTITLSGSATTLGSDTTINIDDGNLTFGGRLTAGANNYDLTITGGDGTIRPSGGLVLNSGTLTMSATGTFFAENSSTYSGGTTVTAGAIQYGNNDAFGTGAITMTGGKFYTSDASDFTIDENLNLQGSITLGNSGDSNTITFSGTNTLTGNTTASIDSAVSMAAIDDGSNTYNLIKSGSGTLTLTGSNGYDGTTTISAGTLTVTGTLDNNTAVTVSSGATYDVDASDTISSLAGAGTIDIASSQTLTAGDSNDKTLSGVISGSGGLTKVGSGTQTLSGTNTYTGATTVSAGTLTVTGSLSDSTAVSVASGAIYDVDVSDTIASVDGAGTIEIANAVTLTTGDANDQELSGTISGSGSITKVGNGILTLSGTNSYSGDTTISAGTLLVTSQLGGGSYAGDISNAGDLGINSSNNQTLSGVISGSGTINKSGFGELTLTGANTFDGTINIAGGTLFAGGSSDSSNKITEGNIIVKGGTLSGSGIIDGNVTFSSTAGTLAPGNSIGTLTINDNLTLSADDTTNIEFNSTTADKIVINGNTELAGTISLYPEDTTYSDVTHTIVDASGGGTFNGTFSTETMNNESNLNDATWDIVYDTSAKTVSLQITEAASTCNINCTTTVSSSKDIAKVFDNATSGTLKDVKDVLDSATVSSVNTELDKLKGTVIATSSIQSNTNHNYFNRAVANTTSLSNTTFVTNFTSTANELTLASLQDQGLYGDKKRYNEYYDYSDVSVLGFIKNNKNKSFFERFESDDRASFLRTFGTNTKRDNIGEGYTGYNSDTTGILFGEQFKKDDINFDGYSIGISKTDTTYNDSYGDAEIYSMHASMFKQIDDEDYAFNLLGSAFVSKTNSNRNVSVFGTSVDDKYKSDFYDVGLNLEAQHIAKYDFNGYKISPSAKINYSYIFKGDTKETGGDLALTVDNEDLFIVKPEVGISVSKNFSEKDNKLSQLELAAFVSRDYFIEGTENKARFASGSTFNHDLPRDKEDYYSLGVGYNFLNKENNTSLMANAFLLENTKEDISSNIFSITFRKFFGEFAKGRIPSVIAKKDIPVKSDQDQNDNEEQTKVVLKKDPPMKSDKDLEQSNEVISSDNEIGKDETIIATFPDQNLNNDIKKDVKEKIKNFEKKIEIVLKENPTKEEVEEIYISLNNEMKNSSKRDLTLDDVYNNLFANCYAVEKNLTRLINYYDKLQLYQILDKCSQLKDPKIHLIANRLHDIQMDERSAIEILYSRYLKILSYIPIVTFIALIILFYEIIRRFITYRYKSRIIS